MPKMRLPRQLFAVLILLSPAMPSLACADPPKIAFRDLVATAPRIFVFQLTSSYHIEKSLGAGAKMEYAVGLVRVVESLRGSTESFKLIRYGFSSCGATRMSVGNFYLAATSQHGPLLQLWGTDQAILDLTLDFYNDESRRDSPGVEMVKSIIKGSPVPKNFPDEDLVRPLAVYPDPPPPKARR